MNVKKSATCLHSDCEDGKVSFATYISTDTDEESEISDAVYAWADGDNASIEIRFSITDCVDDMIDSYCCWSKSRSAEHPPIFGEDSKPMVDSLRAELLAAIERLDSIEFMPLP